MMDWNDYRKEMEHVKMDAIAQNQMMNALHKHQDKNEKVIRWTLRYATVFMVICICVLSVILLFFPKTPTSQKKIVNHHQVEDLAMISVNPLSENGMGGLLTFAAKKPQEDFKTNNPWKTNTNLTTLPVYRNGIIMSSFGGEILEGGLHDKELNELYNKYKMAFQFENETSDVSSSMSISFTFPQGSLEVDRTGLVTINLNVTENFAKQFQKEISTVEEAQEMALRFAKTYQKQLALKNPIPDASFYYRTTLNENEEMEITDKLFSYSVYEKKATMKEQIEEYNFKKVDFAMYGSTKNSNNEKSSPVICIRVQEGIKGKCMGDYPIISLDEAKKKFYEGNYFTHSPKPIEKENIVYVDLVYKYSLESEYMLPFYRMYAPASEDLHYPLKEGQYYGEYFVPAIEEQYINTQQEDAIKFHG